jgi:hypothetical protein
MKAISLVVLCLCFAQLQAQEVIEKHIHFSGKEMIKFNIQIADSIRLRTWNRNEVYITASININDNKNNDSYITSFDSSDKMIIVNSNIRYKDLNNNNCCCTTNIFWDIYVPEESEFSIETINANITITGNTNKLNVNSISGFIDLAIPEDKNADLDLSTLMGTIYSNHNVNMEEGHVTNMNSRLKKRINSGGVPVKLASISGDIFLRKQ